MSPPSGKTLVVSIRHTGTHTLKEILQCPHSVHIHPEMASTWEQYDPQHRIFFVPLIDPKAVWKSWVKRRNRWPGAIPYTEENFLRDWRLLDKFYHDESPIVVPIDLLHNRHQLRENADPNHPCIYEQDFKQYPWVPEFDEIYTLPLVAKYYARST